MLTRRLLCLLLVLSAAGCAGGSLNAPSPAPEDIPELEAALDDDASNVDAGLLLATAYRDAGRTDDAARLVARLRAELPEHTGLLLLDGILREDAGELAEARGLYEEVLAAEVDDATRDEVSRRLEIIRLEELRAEVRQALAREAELADTPDPATVGVFPFAYEGGDPSWEPLSLALAELLITDLGITGRLQVVERVKVNELLRELALSEAGMVEEATAARSGRILGSGYVIQGRYRVGDDARLAVDAAVVRVGQDRTDAVRPVSAEDALEQLFEMEKRLALDLHQELGIQLTPAERARVNERQTESVQALLAFGRGLAATDAGDFEQAASDFAAAAEIDPGFQLAANRRELVRSRTLEGSRRLQSQAARQAFRRRAVQALRNAPAGARARMLRHMTARQRAVLAEVLGQDRLGTAILLELTFRRPGGEP